MQYHCIKSFKLFSAAVVVLACFLINLLQLYFVHFNAILSMGDGVVDWCESMCIHGQHIHIKKSISSSFYMYLYFTAVTGSNLPSRGVAMPPQH